jgi:outer membrane protein assembly factor BamB
LASLPVIALIIFFVGRGVFRQSEEKSAEAAYALFGESKYGPASEDFKELLKRFASVSSRLDEYKSMADLSDALAAAVSPERPDEAMDRLAEFAKTHKGDDVVKKQSVVVAKVSGTLMDKVLEEQKANPSVDTPPLMDKVEYLLAKSVALGGTDPNATARRQEAVYAVRSVHAAWARRKNAHDNIVKQLKDPALPPVQSLKEVTEFFRYSGRTYPGLEEEADVKEAFEACYKRHFDSVVAVPAGESPEKSGTGEIPFRSILFDPPTQDTVGERPGDDSVVLSLIRGVLYAHSRQTGATLWFVRVGIDTTTLPIRVPATAANPERILVLLADTKTLHAFDPDGHEVWSYRLGSPCLGRPVVIDNRVFLPTLDGQVHEVELAAGRPLCRWQLGQPLSVGGTREANSNVIYFPAYDFCVYALNVDPDPAKRGCQAILYTNHPAGSLRGEPLVVAPRTKTNADADAAPELTPGFLILNQTNGLDATQLRVFALPLTKRSGPAVSLNPVPRLRGWTWFPPFHDGEKVVAVTDAGVFSIFGIPQAGNSDASLFPLVPTLNLEETLHTGGAASGRAQVVNVQGDDFWVFSGGVLQRFLKAWNAAVGPKLVPGWAEPLELGSPLHASQMVQDRATGQNTLYVVTHARKKEVYLVTAVNDEDGKKQWQRQMGLVCQGAPLALGRPAGAKAGAADAAKSGVLLAMGVGEELYAIDPERFAPERFAKKDSSWLSGASSYLAGPLDDNPGHPAVLLPEADGLSAYEVAFPGGGNRMLVRHVTFDPTTRKTTKTEQEVKLPVAASPAGPPALVGKSLVVALSDGVLYRVSLSPPGVVAVAGANWRTARVGPEGRGYVAALGPDTLIATDGGKGLSCWKINEQGIMYGLPADAPEGESHALELDERVVAPPLVLPGSLQQVLVAGTGGAMHVLRVETNGALKKTSLSWKPGGRVTAGPFLRTPAGSGPRVGCVLDGSRLVWIDPKKGTSTMWEYKTDGAAIVGQPQLVGDALLVADQDGGMAALDLATGKRRSKPYSLPGSIAPAAPPVAFDGKNLFVPLTDGTALLLPLDLFN